jgi:hypothetical protein
LSSPLDYPSHFARYISAFVELSPPSSADPLSLSLYRSISRSFVYWTISISCFSASVALAQLNRCVYIACRGRDAPPPLWHVALAKAKTHMDDHLYNQGSLCLAQLAAGRTESDRKPMHEPPAGPHSMAGSPPILPHLRFGSSSSRSHLSFGLHVAGFPIQKRSRLAIAGQGIEMACLDFRDQFTCMELHEIPSAPFLLLGLSSTFLLPTYHPSCPPSSPSLSRLPSISFLHFSLSPLLSLVPFLLAPPSHAPSSPPLRPLRWCLSGLQRGSIMSFVSS